MVRCKIKLQIVIKQEQLLSAVYTVHIMLAYVSIKWHLSQPKHHFPFGHFLFKVNFLCDFLAKWRTSDTGCKAALIGGWGQRVVKGQRSEDKNVYVQQSDESEQWGWSRVKRRRGTEEREGVSESSMKR